MERVVIFSVFGPLKVQNLKIRVDDLKKSHQKFFRQKPLFSEKVRFFPEKVRFFPGKVRFFRKIFTNLTWGFLGFFQGPV